MNAARDADARLPLALLRAVRQRDMPPELLPDEDLEVSFPQRFGLSGVVDRQIQEFGRLARRGRRVDLPQIEALLRLIARRPDAEHVFDAAGRNLAENAVGGWGRMRELARHLPESLRYRVAARTLRSSLGDVLIAGQAMVVPSPFELKADDSLTARIDPEGRACRLYGAMTGRVVEIHGLEGGAVVHPECEARGDEACVWRLTVVE